MIDLHDFLVTLLDIAIVIPAAFMCFFPMADKLAFPPKNILIGGVLLFGITLPAGALIGGHIGGDINLVLFPLIAVFFFVYHRCLTVHISRSLAVFMWVMAFMSELSNISTGIDAMINPDLGSEETSLESTLILLILGIASAAVSYYPTRKYCTKLINSLSMDRVWYITIPVTGMFLVINCFLRPQKYETLYVNKVFRAFWVSVLMILAVQLLLTVVFYRIVIGMIEMMNAEERSRIFEMQESRYIKQQKYIEDTTKIRHDFKSMIRTLCDLAESGEYEELKKRLSDYRDDMPKNNTVYYCKENSINAALNYYTDQAQSEGIDLTMRIELPEKLPISDIDICGVIGNILDNAITACREMEESDGRRRIQFVMTAQNNAQLIIVSSNSFSGKVRKQGDRYLSTHRRGGGIGLASIASTARRLGGDTRFSHDSEKKEFYIDVMLPLI